MVVATSLAEAKDGAELVAVDYGPLSAVTHSVTAVQTGAPVARGDASSNISIDAEIGDLTRHECGFCQGGPHRQIRDLGAADCRRADGAARRNRHL
jgi:CO/xanthine dehydrogenase Mo-binding subunit